MIKFIKYTLIGFLNTLLHIGVFFTIYSLCGFSQAISNFIAFLVAASFSYFINAKYNFKSKYNLKKYLFFVVMMGVISFVIGYISDLNEINPLITMIIFTFISLILGFTLSKHFIFKE